MARRVEALPQDPVLVLIEDEEPALSSDEWLALITTDEASDADADAAESIRDLRVHGER